MRKRRDIYIDDKYWLLAKKMGELHAPELSASRWIEKAIEEQAKREGKRVIRRDKAK